MASALRSLLSHNENGVRVLRVCVRSGHPGQKWSNRGHSNFTSHLRSMAGGGGRLSLCKDGRGVLQTDDLLLLTLR